MEIITKINVIRYVDIEFALLSTLSAVELNVASKLNEKCSLNHEFPFLLIFGTRFDEKNSVVQESSYNVDCSIIDRFLDSSKMLPDSFYYRNNKNIGYQLRVDK